MSIGKILESIQPKQRASSTAWLQVMDAWPLPFLKYNSTTPGAVAWFASNQSRHCGGAAAVTRSSAGSMAIPFNMANW